MGWETVDMKRTQGQGELPEIIWMEITKTGVVKMPVPKFVRSKLGEQATVKIDPHRKLLGLFKYRKDEKLKPIKLKAIVNVTQAVLKVQPGIRPNTYYEMPCEWDSKLNAFIIWTGKGTKKKKPESKRRGGVNG